MFTQDFFQQPLVLIPRLHTKLAVFYACNLEGGRNSAQNRHLFYGPALRDGDPLAFAYVHEQLDKNGKRCAVRDVGDVLTYPVSKFKDHKGVQVVKKDLNLLLIGFVSRQPTKGVKQWYHLFLVDYDVTWADESNCCIYENGDVPDDHRWLYVMSGTVSHSLGLTTEPSDTEPYWSKGTQEEECTWSMRQELSEETLTKLKDKFQAGEWPKALTHLTVEWPKTVAQETAADLSNIDSPSQDDSFPPSHRNPFVAGETLQPSRSAKRDSKKKARGNHGRKRPLFDASSESDKSSDDLPLSTIRAMTSVSTRMPQTQFTDHVTRPRTQVEAAALLAAQPVAQFRTHQPSPAKRLKRQPAVGQSGLCNLWLCDCANTITLDLKCAELQVNTLLNSLDERTS